MGIFYAKGFAPHQRGYTKVSAFDIAKSAAKKTAIGLAAATLFACSDPPLTTAEQTQPAKDNFTTMDDGVDDILEIKYASWDPDTKILDIAGEYNGESDATVIVHEKDNGSMVYGSILVDNDNSDWDIVFENPSYVPCRITAMFEDQGISKIMPTVAVVNPSNVCGPEGGNTAPVNMPPTAVMMPNNDLTIIISNATGFASIDFMGDTSFDSDSNAQLSYDWQFTNAANPVSSTSANQVVTYSSSGVYMASLTVTDSAGLSSQTVSIRVTVENPPMPAPGNLAPIAVMTPSMDQTLTLSATTPSTINFMSTGSNDPDSGMPVTYSWLFPNAIPAMSSQANPMVTYDTAGVFTATLSVFDNAGLESSPVSIQVTVNAAPVGNIAPIAVMTPSADQTLTLSATTPSTINFMSTGSNDPDSGMPVTYSWLFPNAIPAMSSQPNPMVTYDTAGVFTATLSVFDNAGLESSPVSIQVTVNDPPQVIQAPNGTIVSTPMAVNNTISINTNNTINFSGTATDPQGDVMTYLWTLDGATPATSTMLSPGIVTYSMAGTYMATLTVTDSATNSDPTPATVTVIVTDATPVNGTVVSLIVLNDLHAHLTLHDDLKRNVNGTKVAVKRGGLARIATEINMIRNNNPNSVLMNIGDTFHGGVEAFYTLGNDIVAPVNALGIDVGVPGNWDFAYGPNVTRARFANSVGPIAPPITIDRPNYPNLAANITNAGPMFPTGTMLPATFTKVVAGITVGFIGISSDMVPFMSPLLATGMNFLQGESNYVTLINNLVIELNNQVPAPDIIVVMSELGIHKDKSIAELIAPGTVDVIFSAHTHELTPMPLPSASGALVVEAGNDTYLGRMDITVVPNMPNSFNWRVIPIEETIVEDATMKALIDSIRAPYLATGVAMVYPGPISAQSLNMPINTSLTTTSYLLSRRNSLENSFNNLMTDLIMDATIGTGTQTAVTTGFRFDATIPGFGDIYEDQTVATGNITIEDIYRFFPVPYILATADILGGALKEVIETNLTRVYSTMASQQIGGWTDGYAGLTINLNLANADGSRVMTLLYKNTGMPVGATDLVTMTGCTRPFEVNSTSFCTNGVGFTNIVPLSNTAGSPLTAVDFIVGALGNGNSENARFPARTDVNDANNTPLWPIGDYIQPLN